MISTASIVNMTISGIIIIAVITGIIVYLNKKEAIDKKPIIFGFICFILFSQMLERSINTVVISANVIKNQALLLVYAVLMAGIFEEVGRFVIYKKFLTKYRQWKDAVAFGVGHGGTEAVLIGVLSVINYINISLMINSGEFNKLIGKSIPADTASQIKTMLMAPSSTFLAIGFERVCTLAIQIALSILVLYCINNKKIQYLFLAIFLHALIDVPAMLYQLKVITNLWLVEIILLILAVIAFLFIKKSKKLFTP
ncbi:YhfC family intramembrane metalloprotease [Clostridium oryzae]|uniref:YhfC family intramembrane metalloprotease n=1 Tax=Clostridium oryzae TaxID=1450648 RepID=A0A1V4IM18_9CLOT|nr:YhfC family intramembrane metalloprotease [Clostridium oryzae]OPJ60966.1 hypothetical protein CLORY_25140 [Clostridium oryzae]